MDNFVHLHVHSHYSLLDGAGRISELVESARSFGMPALALTDHGNLFGAMEFYNTAKKAGIKPILGLEAFISPTTRDDRSMGRIDQASYHLLLLAMDNEGWRNLIKLSSRAYLEGFYYRPRVDRELLAEFNKGLICTTACLGGEVPAALLANQPTAAKKIAGEYLDIFGKDRFFIEVQSQGVSEQEQVNPQLVAIAQELGVGIVGTNDVHFIRRSDKPAHEVLTCISTGKTLASADKMTYPPEIYFKNAQEMRQALAAFPQACDNTLRIADMCCVDLKAGLHLPVFHTPDGSSPEQHLKELARKGLRQRFAGKDVPELYAQRLETELKVIEDKGYCSYFLIVNDFVQYAHRNNIPAGPRGSGVATLLGYSLGFADVDPIRYGLLFERFTDPQRQEAPDIDIDMCQEGRGKIIQYVRQKYGHVAQIITYGTLKARAAVRDVGRVMDIPLPEVDAIAKKVPEGLGVTIEKALEAEPDLKKMYDSDPRVRKLLDFGQRLEGLARHAGVHAAGVIVADEPLDNIVPLCRQSDSTDAITQWDGPTCDHIGLMKMDFLGLRTLTTLQRARELVHRRHGKDFDPEKLDLADPEVYKLFCQGHTEGVFQFESDGMKNILAQMQPSRIEDLIAANAMYRPGPMELIPTYCLRKNGQEKVPSVHPLVDDILAETYGIMAYQEQVMQVLNRLGKLPLNRALTLIKAISKKKEKTIAEERPNFLEGAKENGISGEEANNLFDLILKFAGYGFNKAHSTRYAIIAYQTAWFKVHYPHEFLAALLTFESSDQDKIVQYLAEARRMKIDIAPPDINACDKDFTVDENRVRFGLSAVKGVGEKAVLAIMAARGEVGRFTDLYHFCKNVDLHAVNRSTIEALIKCGAFDSLGAHRAATFKALDQAIELGQADAAAKRSGQMSFFDAMGSQNAPAPSFPNIDPWPESQLLAAEKETLGFYITSHPLVHFAREIDSLSRCKVAALVNLPGGSPVTVGCMIAAVRPTVTKTGRSAGKKMAMITVEDLTGKCDAVIFSDGYERLNHLIQPQQMVFLSGTLDRQRERPSVIVDDIVPMDQAMLAFTGEIVITLPSGHNSQLVSALSGVLKQHEGDCPITLEITTPNQLGVKACIRPNRQWFVTPTRKFVDDMIVLLGDAAVRLCPKALTPSQGNGRRFVRRGGTTPQGQAGPASAAVTRFN
ncbi:MAG: DNA polymerase III subunit alpha [Planctomycetes bacterium]|nr:DNA polymerase III subunit alpha [Planctomycetota bacterium]